MHANPQQMRVSQSRVTRRELMDDFFDSLEETIARIEADEKDHQWAVPFVDSRMYPEEAF